MSDMDFRTSETTFDTGLRASPLMGTRENQIVSNEPKLDDLGKYIVERTKEDPNFLRRVPEHIRAYGEWFRLVVAEAKKINPEVSNPPLNGISKPKEGTPLEGSSVFVWENMPAQSELDVCDQCGERNLIRGTVDLRIDSIPTIRAKVCECLGVEVFEELDPKVQHQALYRGKFW